MSSFETIKRANPYGIEDDVLKITIDSAEDSYRLPNLITEPDTYVFVIWHRTDTPCTISFDILGETVTSESSSQWTKVVKVKKVTDLSNKNIDITPPVNSTTYYYEAYLARGSVDTSWTPAPEDIDDNIESVKSEFTQTAEEIKMSVKNIKGDVSNLNIQVGKIEQSVADNKGNISSLTTTIDGINATVKKQGESISSIDQKADKISQQVTSVKSELNSKIELTAGEITQKVDDVRADLSSEIKQTSDRISQTVTDMNKNLSTRIDQTAKDIELNASKTEEIGTKLDNLEIGGRNLLLNTGFNTFNHWIKGSNTKSLQMVNGWCEVTIGGTWSGFVQEFIPEKNVEYIVSYEAYLVDTVAETAVLETDFGTPDQNQTINKTPAKYSLKLKYPSTSLNGEIDFKLSNNEVGKKWRIRNIKLEKGNKATDWSPAPEDIENELTNNYYNKTQMESKLQIQSDNITANVKKEVTTIKNDLDQNYYNKTETDSNIKLSSDNINLKVEKVEETAQSTAEDLTNYINLNKKELENLQSQIDGSIMTWFYSYVPTNSNKPAVDWNTVDLKNNHLGDLFYDTSTGYCYRWQVQSNQYSWSRVTDVDVTKALSDAAKAQDTADAKRRVFVATPKPPYEVGDLWVQGTSGDIMRCKTAKTSSQSYSSSDWDKASKYTDDTTANGVKNDLKNNYYTKTQTDAQIKVSSDSITSTVKKEITTEVGKINVGGRNLLMNTRDFGGNKWILVGTSTPPVYDTDGMYYIGVVDTWSNYAKQTINIDPGEYIISLYAKSSKQAVLEIKDDSSIHNYVIGNITVSSNTWEKYTLSFKNTYATYPFMFTLLTRQNTSTICVKKIKLEKGNKATDWSPAPEDMATADSLADVNNSLTDTTNDLQSSINSTNKNLQDIQNNQNEVYEIVSQNKSKISSLTQRAEGFSMDFKTVNETVKQINNQFVTERDERYKYIKFIDGEIWLGKEVPIGEDDFKLVIKNDRISFLQNKTEVAYMSNNKLYVTDIHVTNTLQLGQFVWASRANGNVGLRWIGN